jgi:hypothetical protein
MPGAWRSRRSGCWSGPLMRYMSTPRRRGSVQGSPISKLPHSPAGSRPYQVAEVEPLGRHGSGNWLRVGPDEASKRPRYPYLASRLTLLARDGRTRNVLSRDWIWIRLAPPKLDCMSSGLVQISFFPPSPTLLPTSALPLVFSLPFFRFD